jgi:23S rRNA (guanosine2251-2'-O)-methyltransferase
VSDPHNLGACLRTAEGAGVHGVVVPRDRAAGLTPVVRKVASGAAERLPFFQVVNLARSLKALRERGLWVIGAAAEAEVSLYQSDLSGPLVLVLGAEGKGLRRLTRETCDALVRVPLQGDCQSLNVAVATGVCLFEARRQRAVIAAPGGGR